MTQLASSAKNRVEFSRPRIDEFSEKLSNFEIASDHAEIILMKFKDLTKEINKKVRVYNLYTHPLSQYEGRYKATIKNHVHNHNLFEADRLLRAEARKGEGRKRMLNPVEVTSFFGEMPDHILVSGPFRHKDQLHVFVAEKTPDDPKPFSGVIVPLTHLEKHHGGSRTNVLFAEIE